MELLDTNPNADFMWLVAHNRCWTTDRLAKDGVSLIQTIAYCVIKRRKISSTFYSDACFQDRSGSPFLLCHLAHNLLISPLVSGGETLMVYIVI